MSSGSASGLSGNVPALSLMQQLTNSKKCAFCWKELQHSFFIQCAVCDNAVFCADCFSAGVQVGNHVSTHEYRIPVCLENPLFDNSWSAKDDLLLLSAIEKHGVGNWKVISENLNNGKTPKQIEDHYWIKYLGVHGYCLPCEYYEGREPAKVVDLFPNDSDGSSAEDFYRIPLVEGYVRGNPVVRDLGSTPGARPKDRNELHKNISMMPGSEIPGYMPLRQDFEVEFENDAELMLADMEFSPDDHPSERELKLQVLRIYNQKLEERAKRRNFVIERGLIDVKGQQAKEKKLTKDERELIGKLRVFARFHSQEEHEALVDGLLKAQRLRNQIELYKVYRQLGLKTLEEVRKFESDRRSLLKNSNRKSSQASNPYSSSSSSVVHLEEKYVDTESAYNNTPGDRPRKRGRPPKNAIQIEEEPDRKLATAARPNKSTRSSTGGIMPSLDSQGPDFEEAAKFIQKAPGGDLLSKNEFDLCMKLPLFPYNYLAIKDVLVREAHRNGMLTMEGIKRLLKTTDEEKSAQIYDFFVRELRINENPRRSVGSSGVM